MPELDIVIPLYKAEAHLKALLDRLQEWIDFSGRKVRIILVDDGSMDHTFSTLKTLKPLYSFEILGLRLTVNYGQMAATACGLSYAEAPLIATMDDDLQHDPFELEKLIKKMEEDEADLVYGTFAQRKHPFFRTAGSRLLKFLLLEKNRDYTQATSFRLMKSGTAAIFKNINTPVKYIEQYFLHYASIKSSCVVAHGSRAQGRSQYSVYRLFNLSVEFLLFHSSLPLKFITRLGIFMSVVFFVMGLYFIYRKLFHFTEIGYTSIIVSIFFSTGLIMLSLGIIGEYIRRIWLNQNNLERLIVSEELR